MLAIGGVSPQLEDLQAISCKHQAGACKRAALQRVWAVIWANRRLSDQQGQELLSWLSWFHGGAGREMLFSWE